MSRSLSVGEVQLFHKYFFASEEVHGGMKTFFLPGFQLPDNPGDSPTWDGDALVQGRSIQTEKLFHKQKQNKTMHLRGNLQQWFS